LGGRGFASDPVGGAYSAPQTLYLVGRGWLPLLKNRTPLSALWASGCDPSSLAELVSRNEEIKLWSPKINEALTEAVPLWQVHD